MLLPCTSTCTCVLLEPIWVFVLTRSLMLMGACPVIHLCYSHWRLLFPSQSLQIPFTRSWGWFRKNGISSESSLAPDPSSWSTLSISLSSNLGLSKQWHCGYSLSLMLTLGEYRVRISILSRVVHVQLAGGSEGEKIEVT